MPHEPQEAPQGDHDRRGGIGARVADAILSAAADAIVACDTDGIICFWNPGAERLFGYSGDEAVGSSLDRIIPEWLRQRHWDGYRQVMRTGQTRYGASDVLAVPALRKDHTTISLEFTIYPLKSEGRMIGIAAVMRDVTLRFNEIKALKRKLADGWRASAQ